MSADDVTVLCAWCAQREFEGCEFHTNVPVGEVPEGADCYTRWFGDSYCKDLYARRIDALLIADSQWTVIEAKPEGSAAALGQVKMYAFMLRELVPDRATITPMVCCQYVHSDLYAFYRDQGVELAEVGMCLSATHGIT
ncbi:MAG: hypothetical protein ACE5HE_12485 [Phycisphaerae bacterium]